MEIIEPLSSPKRVDLSLMGEGKNTQAIVEKITKMLKETKNHPALPLMRRLHIQRK